MARLVTTTEYDLWVPIGFTDTEGLMSPPGSDIDGCISREEATRILAADPKALDRRERMILPSLERWQRWEEERRGS